jgi:hypothetical protein
MTVTIDGVSHEVVARVGYWMVRCRRDLELEQDPDRTENEVNCMACITRKVEDEHILSKWR